MWRLWDDNDNTVSMACVPLKDLQPPSTTTTFFMCQLRLGNVFMRQVIKVLWVMLGFGSRHAGVEKWREVGSELVLLKHVA